ncbi:uncharacterized protein LOC110696195 [Chenopodium quinoa]|uniref:uncharacterized protein LOC110696195 n=1 Tax=Chenopodium quinoa TaxID=63459 RepID=UPI000B796AD8|nr:uncharacterized protein LOC110696195 [Chenopodium quinoa]
MDQSMWLDLSRLKKYELEESFTALTTLQRGLLLVMCIFVKAGKDNEPVNIVAEAILDAYDAQVWGDEAFETLYRFLRCPDKTLKAVGLTFVTASAKLCTYRARPDLTAVLYKSRIVETVKEMNEYRLTIQRCAKALEAMPLPSESSS